MIGKNICQAAYILRCLWLGCLLFFASPLIAQISLPQATDKPVTQKISGSEQQVYQIVLAAEEYLHLNVVYQGLIVAVTINDPNGKPLSESGGGVDTVATAEIAIIAPAAGIYQLIIQGRGAAADKGSYKLEVKALRPATDQDRLYATAQRTTLEGNRLYNLRTVESRRQALGKFQEALQLWRVSQELRKEIEILDRIGVIHLLLGETRRAQELAQEMLSKSRQAGFRNLELAALFTLGITQGRLANYQLARQTQEQALALSRELQDRTIEVEVLNSLGFINANLGQGRIAIDYYQQSLQVAREIGDRNVEASVLGNLAVRYDNIGEPAQSISYYQTAIALAHQLGKKETEAITLRNLGRLQLRQGELQQALDLAQQSLVLARVGGNPRTVGGALDLLGRTHALLGEYTPAQEYLKQAQAVYEAAEEYRDIAFCLRERSSICMQIGETNQALDLLQQALAIHRRIKQTEAIVADLIDLGALYLKRTELQQSLATLSEALALSRSIGVVQEEARCLLHLSRTHQAMGASEQAKNILQTLLPLAQRMKSRLLEAEVQYDLALLSLKQQHYDESQSAIEIALSIIENSRTGLVNPETRANFRSDNQRYYEIYTDVLAQRAIRQNNSAIAAQALESVERARARSLLDLLTERRIDIRQGVDGELLKREQELQLRLSAKEELLQQFSTKKSDEEQSKSLQAEITTLTVDLQLIESRIRVASPTYAALTQPQPLKLSEIQQHVLDRETVLLEYALGAECSYLFVITSTSLKIAILPKRAEIETAVRKYYELFEKQRSLSIFTDLAKRQKALTQLEREHHDVARTLSKILLQPAAETLQQKRLMIVADGALHYVPFAALPEPRASDFLAETPKRTGTPLAQRPKTKDQPLIAAHEILTLPSASTLAIVRQQLGTRAPAPKMLALFADPVFSHDDQRITVQTRGVNRNTSEQKFTRLLKTRQEAEAIMALVPKTDRLVALDFDANRTLALSEQLNQYRYLHFATHGIWNEKTPALSGLLLSQVDQNGNTQNGFLTIKDVFNHKLASDLVVLSACQTAMGKELQGEGMMGLTRGFMYAGARRVVASLWQVNDAATTKLMQQFYQGMLGEKHLTPAAALRAAQIAMWQDKRWNAPQYWAAFILQGEW